jgi:CBS-domain-containing membrane protein
MARTVRVRDRMHPSPGVVAGGESTNPALSVASLLWLGVFACRTDDTFEHARATMDRLAVDRLAVLDEAGRVVGVLGRDEEDGEALRRLVPAFYSSY